MAYRRRMRWRPYLKSRKRMEIYLSDASVRTMRGSAAALAEF